jgi:hypothetical protein
MNLVMCVVAIREVTDVPTIGSALENERKTYFPPLISIDVLPEAERVEAESLNANFWALLDYVQDIRADALLAEQALKHLDEQPVLVSRWPVIAARDGAMMIFHVGQTLNAYDGILSICPTINALVDKNALREAKARFAEHFPDYAAVRHGVAHQADQGFNGHRRNIHAATYYDRPLYLPRLSHVREAYDRGRLHMTVNGKAVSYVLSQETANDLASVVTLICKAFSPVQDATLTK